MLRATASRIAISCADGRVEPSHLFVEKAHVGGGYFRFHSFTILGTRTNPAH